MLERLRTPKVDPIGFIEAESKWRKRISRAELAGLATTLGMVGGFLLERASFLEAHPHWRLAAWLGTGACAASTVLSIAVTSYGDNYLESGQRAQEELELDILQDLDIELGEAFYAEAVEQPTSSLEQIP